MKLSDLLVYDSITIQCHDNPDADTIASGYGLYCYFKSKGKSAKIIYSGRNEIQKSNLLLMIERIGIPVTYVSMREVEDYQVDGLLLTVDCQYGAGNVTKINATDVAIIDHHQVEIENVEKSHIIPGMGSCSTIIWKLLLEEGFEVTDDEYLGTALYYGLATDTNLFTEMNNPVDRDAQEQIPYSKSMLNLFYNSNISLRELEIAGVAMLRYNYNDEFHFAVIKAQPCDPNILGLISDFLLQVDQIQTCVVYNEVSGGFKLSVRSCIREVNAGELASFLTENIGSGGGHYGKAGGFISAKKFTDLHGDAYTENYFNNRLIEYFESYDMVYAEKYEADISSMILYQKENIPVGFARAKDFLPIGTPITIRTIEGDVDMEVEDDLIVMIGIKGEVYPSRLEKFNRSYQVISDTYDFHKCVVNDEYEPVVKNRLDGTNLKLLPFAGTCIPTGKVQIYAKPLEKAVKVFTAWDKEKYMKGKIGDYLAVRTDDLHDVYVVEKKIFGITYKEV